VAGKLIYVLDACALIAFLDNEDGADAVDDLIKRGNDEEITICMSSINVFEVYYDRLKRDAALAYDFHDIFSALAIQVIPIEEDALFAEAGRLKAAYRKMSIAYAFGLATAACLDGIFVTSDHHELEAIEKATAVKFFWFR
jgi:PIN domain nuclease of toxin-antitoxin system